MDMKWSCVKETLHVEGITPSYERLGMCLKLPDGHLVRPSDKEHVLLQESEGTDWTVIIIIGIELGEE